MNNSAMVKNNGATIKNFKPAAPTASLFLLSLLFLFLSAKPLEACEFTYIITGPGQSATRVIPGIPVTLTSNTEYSLSISYREDHRNCLVPPEDTLFLVEEERWRAGKDYLALELLENITWNTSGRLFETRIAFQTNKPGTWPIQVIRECTRGGYDQALIIAVR